MSDVLRWVVPVPLALAVLIMQLPTQWVAKATTTELDSGRSTFKAINPGEVRVAGDRKFGGTPSRGTPSSGTSNSGTSNSGTRGMGVNSSQGTGRRFVDNRFSKRSVSGVNGSSGNGEIGTSKSRSGKLSTRKAEGTNKENTGQSGTGKMGNAGSGKMRTGTNSTSETNGKNATGPTGKTGSGSSGTGSSGSNGGTNGKIGMGPGQIGSGANTLTSSRAQFNPNPGPGVTEIQDKNTGVVTTTNKNTGVTTTQNNKTGVTTTTNNNTGVTTTTNNTGVTTTTKAGSGGTPSTGVAAGTGTANTGPIVKHVDTTAGGGGKTGQAGTATGPGGINNPGTANGTGTANTGPPVLILPHFDANLGGGGTTAAGGGGKTGQGGIGGIGPVAGVMGGTGGGPLTNLTPINNQSVTIFRGPRHVWIGGVERSFVAAGVLPGLYLGSDYYAPQGYIAVAHPACYGKTVEGCLLRWQQVPLESGGSDVQCVQLCRSSGGGLAPGPAAQQIAAAAQALAAEPMAPAPAQAQTAGGCEVAIYADANFAGQATTTVENQPRLGDVGWKGEIASVQVKGGTWDFFSDDDYGGQTMRLPPGEYTQLGPQWTKQISSFMCLGQQ